MYYYSILDCNECCFYATGVLFTLEPVTGNPGQMIVNASYGLGESVVSGVTEPDNIYISRTWDNKLTIDDRQIGSKKVVINMKGKL